jgi:predicted nucleotidyltransferase
MTKNHLKHYTIGSHILNRSFVSTSKERSIAQVFAGNVLQETSVSVVLKYIIKQNQTAIDIEHMSTVEDEKEVLILPFSVFRIKNRNEKTETNCVEIELEECEDRESKFYTIDDIL